MSEPILHQSFLPAATGVQAYVWKYALENGGRRPRHFHAEPELNLVVSGWAEYGVGERTLRVSKGEVVGFPAGQDHVLLGTSPDVFLFAIGMAPRLVADVLYGFPGEVGVPLHLRLANQELAAITRRAELSVERAGSEQICGDLWAHVHWLSCHSAQSGTGALHVLTKRALQLMSDSPELSLEAVAAGARSCASEVSRYFHRDFGMTFVRYRTRLRLMRFISLVDECPGDWSSAAIAAGFGSYSQCHRTFQSELGCSPRAFFKTKLRAEMQRRYDDPTAT